MTSVYITGCARSGTKYLAAVLENAGVNATHEKSLMSDRGVDLSRCGDVEVSSDGAYRVAEIAALEEVKVIGHVVRHPQQVVASIVGRGMWAEGWGLNRSEEWPALGAGWLGDGRAPSPHRLTEIDRTLLYWITVNEWIEARARVWTFPVTAALFSLPVQLAVGDVQYEPGMIDNAVGATRRDINHTPATPPVEYDWNEHDPWLRERAELLIERYGL